MSSLNKAPISNIIFSYFPIVVLFISAFNEFDFNYLKIEYFSFNFVHILIFFWTLKNPDHLGYVSIFLAGIINDVENYPEDHPSKMKELGLSLKFPFPYLYDETQEVAKLYDAACTPDFNLFDKKGNCVYRGQLDESRPGNDKSVTGSDLRIAMELVVKGSKVPINQIPSCGCNIKWK